MPNTDIAAAVERGVSGQSDLITSLSLAVIGGLLVLLLQVRVHNASNPSQQIEIKRFPFLATSLICAGTAIALGYVISGMLVQMAPQIFSHTFDLNQSFSSQDFGPAPTGWLQIVSISQFLVFLGSVISGVVFGLGNRP